MRLGDGQGGKNHARMAASWLPNRPLPAVPDSPETSFPVLPDFLVIGAMKAGTTTLYHDLRSQAGLLSLPDKESNALLGADPPGIYGGMRKGEGSLLGEVCPDYTKPGTGERAAEVAGMLYAGRTPPKLIYVVRHPIDRLLSHHHFVSSQHGAANPGRMSRDLEASLRDFPELVETSRYATRLRPWIDAFGGGAVKVIRFEDYIADREGVVKAILGFLGREAATVSSPDPARIHNPGDARPVATPFWRRIMGNPIYRRLIRPWLSLELRDRIRARLLPKPPPRPAPPSPETRQRLVAELTPEVEALSELAGAAGPLWDLAPPR